MADNNIKLSAYLCYILRHHPDEIGEPHEIMDIHGWVNVQTLIKAVQSAVRWHLVPVILKISALELYKKGIQFGVTENEVWCADDIPAEAIVDYIYI